MKVINLKIYVSAKDFGLDLANNFATAEAACLVGASLSGSNEFQTLAAWTANVLASRRGLWMIPAVLDRVVLDESMLEMGFVGKMKLPMGFLSPFFPSELWLAFSSPWPRP
jgi:hypothetical protein